MTTSSRTVLGARRAPSARAWAAGAGYLLLAAIVVLWSARALHDPYAVDMGPNYRAGQLAWSTGHPANPGFIGTPLLGAVLMFLTRITDLDNASMLLTVLSTILVVASVVILLDRLRPLLPPAAWWVAAFALVSFAPIMSTVWTKQFNLIALVPAAAGFELVRRSRTHAGAALIAFSIAFKPLAILLPFVLLARRATRRAGLLTVGWIVGLSIVAQALLAWRAGDLGGLNPHSFIQNYGRVTGLADWRYWCKEGNYSPQSTLCQLAGPTHLGIQEAVALVAVVIIGLLIIDALRGSDARSWEVFAFTCALSVLVAEISWDHYQVMLAPLYVVLFVRFVREGASPGLWAGLIAAFALSSLSWSPYTDPVDTARALIAHGTVITDNSLVRAPQSGLALAIGQFGQYVLLFTGVLFFMQSRTREKRMTEEL